MGIKPKFNQSDVSKRFAAFLEAIEEEQIKVLQTLGETCVAHARSVPADIGFTDQTGNLRSSIGYVVFKDGVAIKENYDQVKEGSQGITEGRKVADKAAQKFPTGIVLIVTAGMNYAVYVESKGRDVLTSAEHLATQELPRMLTDLISDIKSQ